MGGHLIVVRARARGNRPPQRSGSVGARRSPDLPLPWSWTGFPLLRVATLATFCCTLVACGSEHPRREPVSLMVHRDTSGLGQVLRLDSVDGWCFRWAGVPLSDPQGIGPTDVVVAVWAVPASPRSVGADSVEVYLPKALSDSLLPDSVRRSGSWDTARWWVRAPRCDPPGKTTSWYHEAACGMVGGGMILVTSTR